MARSEPDKPLLDAVEQPADLRELDEAQLRQLSDEIREFIVRKVSRTGGHLGSNLGAVELTLALHRSFDSPKDILLWDTGHQAYVHKMVTGRKHLFPTLRQKDGLSGYPSRAESEHDWIENSHASTVLSYAHGVATAIEDAGTDRRVVAVIGDGSMTGGMAFEALNNLGQCNSRVVIVLNDNGRSYAPTIGRLSESLSKIRGNPRYLTARNLVERGIKATPVVGGLAAKSVKGMKAAVREAIEPFAFFETLGVRYIGPIDGHDIPNMEAAFRDAAHFDGPIVVHVLTQKGYGYQPAVDDDEKHLHDVKVFDPDLGPQPIEKAGDYTEAFTDAILDIGEKHPQVHAITAAMPGPTGLLPFQDRFPDRFHDVGIAEQHAVTAAAGMAMGGLRPVVAVYSTFFTRAFDQAMFDVGLHNLPVVFALDRSGITGDNGASHHGVLDLALAMRIPGMTVFAPSSAQELDVMLHTAIELEGPATVRWPGGKARQATIDNIGTGLQARLVRSGSDVCIIGVGRLLEAAEGAAVLLEAEGISATVWDPRVVKPLDMKMIEHASRHRLVVTAEDGMRVGGVGSAVTAALEGLESTASPIVRTLGTPDEFIPHAKPDAILKEAGLDAAGIAATVRAALRSTDSITLP
jgi:1-deoxy-D-xylulose-5-phosphate synthase